MERLNPRLPENHGMRDYRLITKQTLKCYIKAAEIVKNPLTLVATSGQKPLDLNGNQRTVSKNHVMVYVGRIGEDDIELFDTQVDVFLAEERVKRLRNIRNQLAFKLK